MTVALSALVLVVWVLFGQSLCDAASVPQIAPYGWLDPPSGALQETLHQVQADLRAWFASLG